MACVGPRMLTTKSDGMQQVCPEMIARSGTDESIIILLVSSATQPIHFTAASSSSASIFPSTWISCRARGTAAMARSNC